MKKGISVLVILIITLAFGIFEIANVKKTLITIDDLVYDLYIKYEANEEEIDQFYNETGDIKEYWHNSLNWLCYIFNHRDLSTITDSINRLRAYTKNNDYDNAICEIELLKDYTSESYHILGFNLHNIL